MIIAFRTDSSLQIGSGHVMRCLTLADELRQRGAYVMFVCREHPGDLIGLIEEKGYSVIRLLRQEAEYDKTSEDVAHAAWLGTSLHQDAVDTIAVLSELQPQWLIIDSYSIDRRWEQMLRPFSDKIMVIDDLADRPHDSDLLLDQNLYDNMENRYDKLVTCDCIKLLGPTYALLRPEFAAARKTIRQRIGQVRRVLLFFGGVDPTNETEKALIALTGITDRQLEVDVVVGSSNTRREEIKRMCTAYDRFYYHCQVDSMAALMCSADFAVGAGGSTTWERSCLGLPSLLVSIALNQIELARQADKNGITVYAGGTDTTSPFAYSKWISELINNPPYLTSMSGAGIALVDGCGAERVAVVMAEILWT